MTQAIEAPSTTQHERALYTAKVHTTGGRDGGASRSDDGRLDVTHSTPGRPSTGTNPEQLLAAGWSACFLSAMEIAARKRHIALPPDTAVDAEVDLCIMGNAFSLRARLNISLPGVDREVAQALSDAADQTCPYSKATYGNIGVLICVV